jgi:hypothetical protein
MSRRRAGGVSPLKHPTVFPVWELGVVAPELFKGVSPLKRPTVFPVWELGLSALRCEPSAFALCAVRPGSADAPVTAFGDPVSIEIRNELVYTIRKSPFTSLISTGSVRMEAGLSETGERGFSRKPPTKFESLPVDRSCVGRAVPGDRLSQATSPNSDSLAHPHRREFKNVQLHTFLNSAPVRCTRDRVAEPYFRAANITNLRTVRRFRSAAVE